MTVKTKRANYESAFKQFKGEMSKQEYRLIIGTLHLLMMEDITTNAAVYRLPHGLGVVGAFKRPTVGRGVFDYKLYNNEGIYRYVRNKHTEGYAINFRWVPLSSNLGSNREIGSLFVWSSTRDHKRKLASLLKGGTPISIYHDY